MKQEIWKKVQGYPCYEVSNKGRVRSKSKTIMSIRHGNPCEVRYKGRILKPGKTKAGYMLVVLYHSIKPKQSFFVHRLVASAFIGKSPKGKHDVMHLDDNKRNNKMSNLRWGSPQDNSDDKVSKGRQTLGSRNKHAILMESDVLKIVKLLKAGSLGIDIARQFCISTGTISNIKTGYSWSHLTGFK